MQSSDVTLNGGCLDIRDHEAKRFQQALERYAPVSLSDEDRSEVVVRSIDFIRRLAALLHEGGASVKDSATEADREVGRILKARFGAHLGSILLKARVSIALHPLDETSVAAAPFLDASANALPARARRLPYNLEWERERKTLVEQCIVTRRRAGDPKFSFADIWAKTKYKSRTQPERWLHGRSDAKGAPPGSLCDREMLRVLRQITAE